MIVIFLRIQLFINDNKLLNETSNLRTEFVDSGFIKILQVGNAVNIVTNNKHRTGSIIDIDCIYNFDNENFFEIYTGLVNKAHDMGKRLFFDLLSDDFINSLKPEY